MSCHSKSCHTPTSTGCGVDLCSTTKLSTNSVIYTGSPLACAGISPCDTLTDALQKLDYRLCNLPLITFTANNGITKTLNNFQLGGPLVQQTVITTTAANSLVIAGLVTNIAPQYLVSQDSSGVLTKTAVSSILGNITANNGLTKTGNNIKLGGALTGATTITTTGTNTLKLAGLVINASPAYVITESSTGELIKTLASSIVPPPTPATTANNGLNMSTVSNVQLGGALTTPTDIVTSGTNTLSITGLSTDNTPDFYLTETTPGVVKRIASATVTSNVLSTLTANNGLTKTGTNLQLGGPLVQNTTVSLGTNELTLTGITGSSTTGIEIKPGVFTECTGCAPCTPFNGFDWTTNVVNLFGKFKVFGVSHFTNNVSIGTAPPDPNGSCGNGTKLYVSRVFTGPWSNTFSGGRGTASAYLELSGNLGIDTSTVSTNGATGGTLAFRPTSNTQLKGPDLNNYTAVGGRISFDGSPGITVDGVGGAEGILSNFSSRTQFSGNGDLETIVGFHACAPYIYQSYGGTLTNAVGVQIENQRSEIDPQITNSWGIKQLGVDDKNLFNAEVNIFPNLVDAIDDTAAGLAGVPQWGLYRTGNVVKINITP